MSRRSAPGLLILIAIFTCAIRGQNSIALESRPIQNPEQRILTAIDVLLQIPSGRALITKAIKTWKMSSPEDLTRVLKPGSTSRTDAVLTRHYNPETGVESRDREVTVYVRQDQSLGSIVLDIAHEMVHATTRPSWDPYDPELTPGRYIKSAIEGEGGEIDAVQTECQVAIELSRQYRMSLHRCKGYYTDGKPDLAKIRSDFYRVGKWSASLNEALGGEISLFPLLSEEAPKLYSSTGNAPYPVALLTEFQDLTHVACENSKKRAQSLKGRSLASINSLNQKQNRFLEQRCKSM